MLLFVKELRKEANLYAYGIEGDEVTFELLRLLCPEYVDDDCGVAFYKLSEEEKREYQTKADYAIARDIYKIAYGFIENVWRSGIEQISGYMNDNKLTRQEAIGKLTVSEEKTFIL